MNWDNRKHSCHYGQAAAEALTLTNPRLILDGAPLP